MNKVKIGEMWYHEVYGWVTIVEDRSKEFKSMKCAIACRKHYDRPNEIFLAFNEIRFLNKA